MSYNALVVQVLISSPSDLPVDHRELILRSLRVWNLTHGRIYGIHFSPTDWKEGGSPAFGTYPQEVLNEQIVKDSDVGIIVFTERLGTPTPGHPSGTAEEIDRLLASGREVAVLQNDCPRAPARGASAAKQKHDLENFLKDLQTRAFIASYESTERLREVMDALLTRLASKYRREADAALVEGSVTPVAQASSTLSQESSEAAGGVWPRVEVTETPETDNRGRLRTKRRWYLVLESTFSQPVYNIRFRYEDAQGQPLDSFDLMGDRHEVVDILPPRGSLRFPILQSMESPAAAMCIVTWESPLGVEQTTKASVRTH